MIYFLFGLCLGTSFGVLICAVVTMDKSADPHRRLRDDIVGDRAFELDAEEQLFAINRGQRQRA